MYAASIIICMNPIQYDIATLRVHTAVIPLVDNLAALVLKPNGLDWLELTLERVIIYYLSIYYVLLIDAAPRTPYCTRRRDIFSSTHIIIQRFWRSYYLGGIHRSSATTVFMFNVWDARDVYGKVDGTYSSSKGNAMGFLSIHKTSFPSHTNIYTRVHERLMNRANVIIDLLYDVIHNSHGISGLWEGGGGATSWRN